LDNLKQIQRNKQAVKHYWETHGLHTLLGETYQERWSREIYTLNWMAIIRACIGFGELQAGSQVLEVGCGWGRIIVGLKLMLPELRIHGIDLVYELIQHAKAVVPAETGFLDAQLNVGDAQWLPFKTAYFDAVISARVLQYVPDPERAVKEFARVVKPGGKVVVFLPNKLNPIRWFRYPAKLYAPSEIRTWFEKAELEGNDTRSICFTPQLYRFNHRSPLLFLEALQKVPVINHLGGLAAVSGRRPR
jgi:SAM-dependent methyltransferase